MPLMQLYSPANSPWNLITATNLILCPITCYFTLALQAWCITPELAESIDVDTRGQASNKQWYQERSKRICTSTFGRICRTTKCTDLKKLAYDLTHPVNFFSSYTAWPWKWVQSTEDIWAITGLVVHASGLRVSLTYPMLAASPDGIVDDKLTACGGEVPLHCTKWLDNSRYCPLSVQRWQWTVAGHTAQLLLSDSGTTVCNRPANVSSCCVQYSWLQTVSVERDDAAGVIFPRLFHKCSERQMVLSWLWSVSLRLTVSDRVSDIIISCLWMQIFSSRLVIFLSVQQLWLQCLYVIFLHFICVCSNVQHYWSFCV